MSSIIQSRGPRADKGSSDSRPQLLDNAGRNVTPKPFSQPPPAGAAPPALPPAGGAPPSAPNSVAHSENDDAASAGGFTEDGDGASEAEGGDEGGDAEAAARAAAARAAAARASAAAAASPLQSAGGPRAKQRRERLTEAELDALVTLQLHESETTILFSLAQQRVLQDSDQHKVAAIANERYDAACSAIAKGGPELYPSRGVQTIDTPVKNKYVSVVPPASRSTDAQADSWDIFDVVTMGRDSGGSADAGGGAVAAAASAKAGATALDKVVESMVMSSLAAPGCLVDADASVKILPPPPPVGAGAKGKGAKGKGVVGSSSSSSSNSSSSSSSSTAAAGASSSMAASAAQKSSVAASSTVPVPAAAATAAVPAAASAAAPPKAEEVDPATEALQAVKAAAAASWASSGDDDGEEVSLTTSSAPLDATHHHKAHAPASKLAAATAAADTAAAAIASSSAASEVADDELEDGAGPLEIATQVQATRVLGSRSLLDTLGLVERAIQQNLYQASHRLYRSGPAQDLLERMLDAGLKSGHAGAAAVIESNRAASAKGAGGAAGAGKYGFVEGSAEEAEAEAEGAAEKTVTDAVKDGEDCAEGKAGEDAGAGDVGSSAAVAAAAGAVASEPADESVAPLAKTAPGLLKLWTYTCDAVAGLNVSAMVWNRANRDLLAVSYGPYDFAQAYTGKGCIALWNLSNPEFPQAILHAPDGAGVTAIDFSKANPSLLVAGLYDGSVCVYDVAKVLAGTSDGWPELCSDQLVPGTHTEAVWQVKWVETPNAEAGSENIVSISTDGKVLEWQTKKGLTFEPLMVLKRARSAPEPGGSAGQAATAAGSKEGKEVKESSGAGSDALGATDSEGLLSRTASGLAFDFSPTDSSQYVVGTEDGLLARCSTSYAEQYLDVVQAHSGPVNRVRLSPFLPSACLTASSDWTVRLWRVNLGGQQAAGASGAMRPLTFSTDGVHEAIADVAWSPSVATRFASVARDGQVQIWDASVLQPLLDVPLTVDEGSWRAELAKEAEAREAELQRLLEEERNRRRAEEEGVEEDEDFEKDVLTVVRRQQARAAAGAAEPNPDEDEDAAARAFEQAQAAAVAAAFARGPPRKKLSCVLFADNTHVLLTGDASGAVDVFRIQGIVGVGGNEDVLSTTTSVPSVGSEPYEAQLEQLDKVLATMV
jgi:hypothetical protein